MNSILMLKEGVNWLHGLEIRTSILIWFNAIYVMDFIKNFRLEKYKEC